MDVDVEAVVVVIVATVVTVATVATVVTVVTVEVIAVTVLPVKAEADAAAIATLVLTDTAQPARRKLSSPFLQH